MKKRILCVLLCGILCFGTVFSAASCGASTPSDDTSAAPATSAAPETDPITEPATEAATTEPVQEETTVPFIETLTPASGEKIRIAFIGDSITEGVGAAPASTYSYPAQLQKMMGDGFEIGNFGKSSSYVLPANNKYNVKDKALSYKNTAQYKQSLKFGADIVVIMLGTNDIRSMSCEEAKQDFKAALADLAKEYAALETVKRVYIATSILTVNSPTILQLSNGILQQLQREVAKECGFELMDVYAMTKDYLDVEMHYTNDRVHPVNKSYTEITKAIYAVLSETEFTPTAPEKSETGVVYVKGRGRTSGRGSTPDTAVNSLAKAVGLLRDGGGTIVICDDYALKYEHHLPVNNGVITITSNYDGTDYRASANASLGLDKSLYLYGDFIFKDLILSTEMTNPLVVCNYNNVDIEDTVTTQLPGTSTTGYPLLVVGYNTGIGGADVETLSMHEDCNVTVSGGHWLYVKTGNRRSLPSYPIGTIDEGKTLTVTINGGVYTNTGGANLLTASGMNSVDGTCKLIINGGTFNGPIYVVGRAGTNTTPVKAKMNGTVTVEINGGEFKQSVMGVQDNSIEVNGSYSVTVTEALKNKVVGIADVTVK